MEIINGINPTNGDIDACSTNTANECMLGCGSYCACLSHCLDWCPEFCEIDICVECFVNCVCPINA